MTIRFSGDTNTEETITCKVASPFLEPYFGYKPVRFRGTVGPRHGSVVCQEVDFYGLNNIILLLLFRLISGNSIERTRQKLAIL
jgi:hypothetical protein